MRGKLAARVNGIMAHTKALQMKSRLPIMGHHINLCQISDILNFNGPAMDSAGWYFVTRTASLDKIRSPT